MMGLLICIAADLFFSILAESDEDKITLKIAYRYLICIPLLGYIALNGMNPALTDEALVIVLIRGYIVGALVLFIARLFLGVILTFLIDFILIAIDWLITILNLLGIVGASFVIEVMRLVSWIKRKKDS